MKKALVVALVIVLVVIGLPMLMPGMGVALCDECGPALLAGPLCVLAILSCFVLAFAVVSQIIRPHRRTHRHLLRASLLDRPPQLGTLV